MKKFTTFVIMLTIALSVSAQGTSNGTQGEQPQRRALFERKNKVVDPKYMQGGVPEVNGKVTWTKTFNVEGQTADQIYDKALAYFSNLVKSENQTEKSSVAGVDRVGHKIMIRSQEWLVFSDKLFALDRTKMNYAASIECSDGVCKVLITNISYNYEEDRPTAAHYTAEEMIADKVAFNKKGTGFAKGGVRKFRIGTIDRMDQILRGFGIALKS